MIMKQIPLVRIKPPTLIDVLIREGTLLMILRLLRCVTISRFGNECWLVCKMACLRCSNLAKSHWSEELMPIPVKQSRGSTMNRSRVPGCKEVDNENLLFATSTQFRRIQKPATKTTDGLTSHITTSLISGLCCLRKLQTSERTNIVEEKKKTKEGTKLKPIKINLQSVFGCFIYQHQLHSHPTLPSLCDLPRVIGGRESACAFLPII